MTAKLAPRLIAPGVIAVELRVPLHGVLHILAIQHIRPAAGGGTVPAG